MTRPVSEYTRKRNFDITREPPEKPPGTREKAPVSALSFVVHKHAARNLHYDFRLELDGTLKSWAVPKGPSLDPANKRLAVHVEDHPLAYGSFEGRIPEGQYGAGDVIIWDRGIWQPQGDPLADYEAGKLKFTLVGEKLSGDWTLVRTRLRGSSDKQQWLLIKENDAVARPSADYDILEAQPQSVISGAEVGSPKKTRASPKPKATVATPGKTSRPVSLPKALAPQLATLLQAPPAGEWLYEIKFDGYRLLARILDGEVRLFTRNGHDWTDRLPLQAKALEKLKLQDSWLDGEVVMLDESGLPDFQALQNAFDIGRSKDLIYYLFDAPFLDTQDLREWPVEQRRAALEKRLGKQRSKLLRFSAAFTQDPLHIVESARLMGLEGVIGKRVGSLYSSARSADWIKLKSRLRQEFVIVGFTLPQGSRSGLGALLLAVYAATDEPTLRYAGRVGSGFGEDTLKKLRKRLEGLQRESSPLAQKLSAAQARGVQWVEPQWVCEVEFAQWTREGLVRQAAFIALRSDKAPGEVTREHSGAGPELRQAPVAEKARSGRSDVAGVIISHANRVIDADSGAQKIDLARYYEHVAPWLLPFLADRPVALLRCPEGIDGEQFFQKHAERLEIPHIKQLAATLDPGHARLMAIDSVQALVGAAQMGMVELHAWGANSRSIDTPDQMVLDLDPDPALPWRSMIEATQLTLAVLDELRLDAFLKTSGGKGLHIVVPLARQADWDTVKAFAKAIAVFVSGQLPERFTATMGPKNRIGKIFIDYLRNARGASTVVAYSARARPGLPVSVPIGRDELQSLASARQWHIGNLAQRLASLSADPWAGYSNRQRISARMWRQLGVDDR